MTSLIIDTSIAVKWINQDNEGNIDNANKILENARDGHAELFSPELLKYEIGKALLYGKKIATGDIDYLLSIFYALPITFVSQGKDLAHDTYVLAKNLGITYYDASFLSLAKQYNATLVTENIKHQGKSSDVKVTSLKDY